VQKGIPGVIIEAGGFEEVGDFGLINEIKEITENFTKTHVLGPNCMGITRVDEDNQGFFSAFNPVTAFRGNVAVITQSGFLNGGYLSTLSKQYPGMGFRYITSVGNKSDLSELEFLEYYIEDDSVNVIALYLESFKDPREFLKLVKRAKTKPNKTIILLKGGVTEQGSKATLSHTGAISGDARLNEGIIRQSGVIPAESFFEQFQLARIFSMVYSADLKMPSNGNFAFLTTSGGAGTVSTDIFSKSGLNFPKLKEEEFSAIRELYPAWMEPNRFALLDLWVAMEHMANKGQRGKVYRVSLDTLLGNPEIDAVGSMVFCDSHTISFRKLIVECQEKYKKPIFCWLVGPEYYEVSKEFDKQNVPNFLNLNDLIKSFKALIQESNSRSI
jgi:acyl-CoA synthetase (NDP forming)